MAAGRRVAAVKPMRPVPRGCRAGFCRGRYKVRAEDFVVDELPAYPPSGTGAHAWLWIEKRALSTLDLLRELGEALGVDERALGIAGLKDARSISRQWVSVALDAAPAPADFERLAGARWRVLAVSRHHHKLRLGHLAGNRFAVVLRGTAPDDLDRLRENLGELAAVGVPNYFGEQRFGKRGANLQKGLEVLRGDARRMARRLPRRVFGLVLSAVQSEVFNRVVAARLDALGTLWPGDLAVRHDSGACFPVADAAVAAAEQPRADRLEISPSGPMPGPEMPSPAGAVLDLERRALEALELSPKSFEALPFGLGRGERRPLRLLLREPEVQPVDGGAELRFTLGKGGYATAVLRELLTEAIWFGPG